MWLKLLQDFNGVRLIHESDWLSSDNIELYTDSSGNPELGCGAYCRRHWSYLSWPLGWESLIFKEVSFNFGISPYTTGNVFVGEGDIMQTKKIINVEMTSCLKHNTH